VAEIRGAGEGRGRAPAGGRGAGSEDGPGAWATGARVLGLWSLGKYGEQRS